MVLRRPNNKDTQVSSLYGHLSVEDVLIIRTPGCPQNKDTVFILRTPGYPHYKDVQPDDFTQYSAVLIFSKVAKFFCEKKRFRSAHLSERNTYLIGNNIYSCEFAYRGPLVK